MQALFSNILNVRPAYRVFRITDGERGSFHHLIQCPADHSGQGRARPELCTSSGSPTWQLLSSFTGVLAGSHIASDVGRTPPATLLECLGPRFKFFFFQVEAIIFVLFQFLFFMLSFISSGISPPTTPHSQPLFVLHYNNKIVLQQQSQFHCYSI